jgi:hypothetical protein
MVTAGTRSPRPQIGSQPRAGFQRASFCEAKSPKAVGGCCSYRASYRFEGKDLCGIHYRLAKKLSDPNLQAKVCPHCGGIL